MKNKILSMLAAIAVAMTLSACQAGDTGQMSPLSEAVTTVVEETAESIKMKTIEPPEDGWTIEQLNEFVYINNQKITNPLRLSFLENMFEIEEITYLDSLKSASAVANIDDKYVFSVSFHYDLENKINKESSVKNIVFSSALNQSEINNTYLVSINGVGLNTHYDDMIERLGYPTEINDSMMSYVIDNQKLNFRLNNEKYIDFITLSWEE